MNRFEAARKSNFESVSIHVYTDLCFEARLYVSIDLVVGHSFVSLTSRTVRADSSRHVDL